MRGRQELQGQGKERHFRVWARRTLRAHRKGEGNCRPGPSVVVGSFCQWHPKAGRCMSCSSKDEGKRTKCSELESRRVLLAGLGWQ